jgi:hypothetical protein
MGDGSGGGIGGAIKDAAKDMGSDLTTQLGKDIFEQISGGKSTKTNTNDPQGQGNSPQLKSVQRNIQIANLSKKIRSMKHRQVQVSNQGKQQEQQKAKTEEDDRKKRYSEDKDKKSFGGKMGDMFSNWGNTLARRNKGEQRGNKSSG